MTTSRHPLCSPPAPLEHDPRSVRPPFTEPDPTFEQLRRTDPTAWRRAVQLDRVAALREPLAGVELSDREHTVLVWLAGFDIPTIAAVVRLLHAARAADPLDPHTKATGSTS